MHLMTFMTVKQPSRMFRAMILGAQGVFYNAFCEHILFSISLHRTDIYPVLSYILAPSACHRFVGYLEEEAVHTYTNCIRQIEAGHLPEW
jgi:ubiquinol oxidase